MMNTTAISTAFKELLEGTIGSVRTLKTSEYLDEDPNDFTTWDLFGVSPVADQAFGPSGKYTADRASMSASFFSSEMSTLPDNTSVTCSIYAQTASGTKQFRLVVTKKDA
ncbi:unnamed protein product, partial [marine sediment metagenome]